jgi:hypothetical protein
VYVDVVTEVVPHLEEVVSLITSEGPGVFNVEVSGGVTVEVIETIGVLTLVFGPTDVVFTTLDSVGGLGGCVDGFNVGGTVVPGTVVDMVTGGVRVMVSGG